MLSLHVIFLLSFLFSFSSFSLPHALSSLCGLLFANIQLQTILCVWQRKQFYCLVTPGGIWCLWCCLGQASPRKVNYLWPALQGGTWRCTLQHQPSSSEKADPPRPRSTFASHSGVSPCRRATYWDQLPGIQIYRLQIRSKGERRHFLPDYFLKKVLLGATPKSEQRVCSSVSRANTGAQHVAKNMHSQC